MIRQILAGLLLAFAVAGCHSETSAGPGMVDRNGEGEVCGGIAGVECGAGLYCDFPRQTSCGRSDQAGTCTELPSACVKVYAPVCGCDGKTYGNDCEAASEGMSVGYSGECKPDTAGH